MAQSATQRAAKRPAAHPQPTWAHGTFRWNELMTRDVERAKRFYKSTIGWTFESMPMADGGGTYWLAMVEGRPGPVAGMFSIADPQYKGVPECWMPYLAVDDVDKRVAKALKAGAKLMKPIFEVPGVGRIAVLQEPGGAGIGWMTPATQ
jgi:predicted enzyme related to lactoylglutathione lyase